MNRRTFLKASGGATLFLTAGPVLAATPSNVEPRTSNLSSLAHRTAPPTFRVVDSTGKPIRNAKISAEQLRHHFLFGCNLFMWGRCGDTGLEDQYRARFAGLLNYATLGFYWANYEAQQGKPDYAYTEKVLDWTARQGITCKGHPLVWDHPAGSPRWLPDDPAAIERLSKGRVHDVITHFKDHIHFWDVVNEATHLPDKVNRTTMARWAEKLGGPAYVRTHLEVARHADPHAHLIVNDYRTDPPCHRLLQELRSGAATPFDIVGIQSHMHGDVWPVSKTVEICDRYADLNLPLHFTETTILSGPRKGPGESWGETTPELEAIQADKTEQFYRTLFSHPAVQAITWWDFSDRGAWQRAAAGFLRKDMSPKPVYDRLLKLIREEWWTKEAGTTNAAGEWQCRAFYGTHRITAELPNGHRITKEITLLPAGPTTFDITT